ncbi:polysaccharide biosynthesis C-terminal domain-containing protein [Pseudomonas sp. B11D7D]|nr:polysaccharide biosynthesis C-terminal domain-containing protein [Pseudomonas sp. B11D7D]QNH04852.1 polysaccharide biosynthesis C-terminal domain-containing protein [Pseudomonas sp. B11D7D]
MNFYRAALGSLGVQLLGVLLSFLLALVLARSLGPAGYGVYAFCFSVAVIVGIPVLSALPTLVVRQTARQGMKGARAILRHANYYVLGYILCIGFICFIFILFRSAVDVEKFTVLLLVALLVPLQGFTLIRGALLRGLGQVVVGQLPETVLRPLFFFILVLAFFVFADGAELESSHAMALHVMAAFGALVAVDFILRRKLKGARSDEPASVGWRLSLFPLTCVAGLQIINQQVDILLLGGWHEDAEVGIYRVAVQLASLVGFGLVAINQMLHPQFSRLYAEGKLKELQALVTLSSRVITIIGVLSACFFWLAGGALLETVFGEQYQSAYLPLIILVAGQVANALFGSVGALLNMTGHEKDTLFGMLLACIVNLSLGLFLVPEHGMLGAAIATAISFLVWNLVLWIFVRRRLGIESTAFSFRRD